MSVVIPGVPVSVDQVLTVHGERELFRRAGHLFEPREEFACAAIDMHTWARTGTREAVTTGLQERTAAGVRIYKLYTARAIAAPEDGEHLTEVSRQGVRVRIFPGTLAHEAIIVDRRVAILAGPSVAGVRSYSVVDVPDVVAAVRALYQATWEAATELAEVLTDGPPVVDEQGLAILRMLSGGRKDASAARALGMSVRTYRRRVAELMVLLGADSRFQAGVRAKALGLPV